MTTQTGTMWRFFQNEQGLWKWQQISLHREIIDEALQAFADYEACVSDAMGCGYQFAPSQPCSVKARYAPIVHF